MEEKTLVLKTCFNYDVLGLWGVLMFPTFKPLCGPFFDEVSNYRRFQARKYDDSVQSFHQKIGQSLRSLEYSCELQFQCSTLCIYEVMKCYPLLFSCITSAMNLP